MSNNHYLSGKSADVRTIMPVQLQNQLPGFATRISNKRTTAPCGFFVCGARLHPSMVGRAGESKDSPGLSCLTGIANPVRLTTNLRFATLGGEFQAQTGVRS